MKLVDITGFSMLDGLLAKVVLVCGLAFDFGERRNLLFLRLHSLWKHFI